jgi:putative ABC transport system substrate-binding protein
MRRRAFITLLGGAAAWPLAARAQQRERMRHIGVLAGGLGSDAVSRSQSEALEQGLQQLGWTDGRNVRIDYRWAGGNADNIRKYSAELVALAPDVILVAGTAAAGPLLQATRTVPVVFVNLPDPVGAGYVKSLARPGGNATGFTNFEYGLSAKWLQLLREIAPSVRRVIVLRDPTLTAGTAQFAAIQTVAPSLGVEVSPVDVRDAAEIESGLATFAQSSNAGLITTQSASALVRRELILTLAARHKLPAVYVNRFWSTNGGLMSYGANVADEFRRAAGYVDRILRGEKPANLPVQAPTKYELVINLKTAKALGIDIPTTLLASADEVIE